MQYSLDKNAVFQWCSDHSYATMRFFDANRDYVAARCCILNGLFSGFILASQSIEKLLKAAIYLENGEQIKHGHDPYNLKERLKKVKDYDLDSFDNTLKKLNNHYLSRYYENRVNSHEDGSSGASSDELRLIDEFWFLLVDKLSMPDEVKYRMAFFADLLEPNPYWSNGFWLTKDNFAFKSREVWLLEKYKDIHDHLYRKI